MKTNSIAFDSHDVTMGPCGVLYANVNKIARRPNLRHRRASHGAHLIVAVYFEVGVRFLPCCAAALDYASCGVLQPLPNEVYNRITVLVRTNIGRRHRIEGDDRLFSTREQNVEASFSRAP